MGASAFIEPTWLAVTRGKAFFYPSAGCDWKEPLGLFGDQISEFWFADIKYRLGLQMAPVYKDNPGYRLLSKAIFGDPTAEMDRRDGVSHLQPSILREVYQRTDNTGCITINRRRGFGQYALVNEFSDRGIGIFMHRRDSPGESGSNVYFLANLNSRHEPCGRLFEKLSRKLADSALIITDGSNTDIKRLKAFHRREIEGVAAYSVAAQAGFSYGGFGWQCVGYMSNGYGPTLVWGITRQI